MMYLLICTVLLFLLSISRGFVNNYRSSILTTTINNVKLINNRNIIINPSIISASHKMSTLDDKEEVITNKLPNKEKFNLFYQSNVLLNNEITLDQLIKYPEINNLIIDGLLYMDDINDLWQSTVGDSNALNKEEAYEFLCMLLDIPDPEDIEYFNKEFNKISNNKDTITFYQLLGWSDIQEILNENVLSMEDITNIYRDILGDLNKSMNNKLFIKYNLLIDDYIDDKESNQINNNTNESSDSTAVNVFDPSFIPENAFDKEVLDELINFFNSNSNPITNSLSKDNFFNWSDIKELLNEGTLTIDSLTTIWNQASNNKNEINLNNFLRLNIQIDLLLDELEEKSKSIPVTNQSKEENAENYYKNTFNQLTNSNTIITFDEIIQWDEINDLINDSIISTKQLTSLFNSYPQILTNDNKYGIDINSFILFNNMLDIILDNNSSNTSTTVSTSPPAGLKEEARPMPKINELTIGSLEDDNDNNSNELTTEELELMQVIDKADTLLNSGSFVDFDRLIGDENDPRLDINKQTIDSKNNNKINDIINNILILSKQQARCGIDSDLEDYNIITLRDNCQLLYESTSKLYTLPINVIKQKVLGQWKLLYSNSEMFRFYHGITGFTNVFPNTKFLGLTIEYISDGYLNEIKYNELLSTPIGESTAIVSANYDLLKENSFITNDQSIILRCYCNKVVLGPLTYNVEENWKSLRTFAMNEIIYVDDDFMLMRNAGALRVYFILERVK